MSEHSQPNVLVTGAAGFLGGNLIRQLLAQGERVRAGIHRDDSGIRGLDVERLTMDVTDPTSVASALEGIDTVYHCAAVISIQGDKDGRVSHTNISGPKVMTDACLAAGVRRLVHVSSVHSLHPLPDDPIDETRALVPPDYWSAYARTKAEGERAVLDAVSRGLDAVIVNPSGMIGPFDFKPSLLGLALSQLYNRSLPALVNAGYDFVDVRDVAAGMIQAAKQGRKGERYLLTGRYRTITDLAKLQVQLTGRRSTKLVCPMWIARASAPLAEAWGKITGQQPLYTSESMRIVKDNAIFNTNKARTELGYHPRPIEETLRDSWEWLAQNSQTST